MKIDNEEKSNAIEEIINIDDVNEYQDEPIKTNFNYFNINFSISLLVICIILGVIIAYSIK